MLQIQIAEDSRCHLLGLVVVPFSAAIQCNLLRSGQEDGRIGLKLLIAASVLGNPDGHGCALQTILEILPRHPLLRILVLLEVIQEYHLFAHERLELIASAIRSCVSFENQAERLEKIRVGCVGTSILGSMSVDN